MLSVSRDLLYFDRKSDLRLFTCVLDRESAGIRLHVGLQRFGPGVPFCDASGHISKNSSEGRSPARRAAAFIPCASSLRDAVECHDDGKLHFHIYDCDLALHVAE